MKQLIQTIGLLFWSTSCFLTAQSIIHVPSEIASIQGALNIAEDGTTILVAPGTYYESLVWPEEVDGIELIGEQGRDVTFLDGQGANRVIKMSGDFDFINDLQTLTKRTVLKGFTIQNGYVSDEDGAGLDCYQASPTLVDLKFINNIGTGESVEGIGASLYQFEGIIQECSFIENEINSTSRAYGAGLSIYAIGDVQIRNCDFIGNESNTLQWCFGGGLYCRSDFGIEVQFELMQCRFEDNSTSTDLWSYGAGAYFSDSNSSLKIDSSIFSNNTTFQSNWSHGAGLYVEAQNTEILNSKFFNNSSEEGSAIYCSSNFDVVNNVNIGNTHFSNNWSTISGNSRSGTITVGYQPIDLFLENCIMDHNQGPSIHYDNISNSGVGTLELDHCTIAYNREGIKLRDVSFEATNSIFYQNSTSEIVEDNWSESQIFFSHCLINDEFPGENNIKGDPLLAHEFLLVPTENSPCLNAGKIIDVASDFEGNPRPMPSNSFPDIGAYELDQYFAHVQVKFFLDINKDGLKDENEYYTSLGSIKVNDDITYSNVREEGIYVIAQPGSLILEYDNMFDPVWESTGAESYTFLVDTEDFSEELEIGLSPNQDISDVQLIITSDRFRCGEDVDFSLSVKNNGTRIEQGIVWLYLDERLTNFSFEIDPDYTDGNLGVGWYYSELLPGACLEFKFTVTAPLIDNEDELGELYCFSASLGDGTGPRSSPYIYKAELRCSFDPNDKRVNPFREDHLALNDADLVYTIRFQNTGNDYAYRVTVADTLDVNLDISTFDLINSSHAENLVVSFVDERVVHFEFSNIYLPDSLTNEPESHGHITYSIQPLENVELNTTIENTAYIYFDFNPAIITNQTESIIVDEFPTVSTAEQTFLNIKSFPNPATDFVYLNETVDRLRVYNTLGQIQLELMNTEKIDVSALQIGSYIVEYHKDGNLSSDTWIIVR